MRTLAAPFNKMRMCIFPKSYAFNENEPVYYPFERDAGKSDPYRRLASVHNGGELENMYDHSKAWITDVSLQSGGAIFRRGS
ncbi:MAG: hypothetical protein LC126_27470 [Bryobacterales bacterium]|nr:hypothetical protein [Bryobacterales bacterium]